MAKKNQSKRLTNQHKKSQGVYLPPSLGQQIK